MLNKVLITITKIYLLPQTNNCVWFLHFHNQTTYFNQILILLQLKHGVNILS